MLTIVLKYNKTDNTHSGGSYIHRIVYKVPFNGQVPISNFFFRILQ